MSSKLDQSLDTIMNEAGTARAGRRGRGRGRRVARAAPVGGVRKSTRTSATTAATTKTTAKVSGKAETAASASGGSTKVIVSNLPHDVPESDIKEFFTKVAGPIKRVMLTYGPNGQSRGIATLIFHKAASGAKALEQNGTIVDKRALRIEAVMDASSGNSTAKTLSERVTAPNAQPKKATAEKATEKTANSARGGKRDVRARGRGGRARGTGRPKKKTAAELDQEMTDYFGADGGNTAAGSASAAAAAPAAAANGTAAPAADDLGMDDIS